MIWRRVAGICVAGLASLMVMVLLPGQGVIHAATQAPQQDVPVFADHGQRPTQPPVATDPPVGPGVVISLPPALPTEIPVPTPTPTPVPPATLPPSPTPVTLPDVTITPSALADPTEAAATPTVSPQALVPAGPTDGVAPVVAGILLTLLVLGGGAVALLITLR